MAEPVAVAAVYGVETVVEGAVAAALVVKRPTMPLKANWRKISGDVSLPRSMHTISLVKGKAYLFGGEDKPQHAGDNDMHVFTLPTTDEAQADYKRITDDPTATPPVRAGHAAAVISDRIYIFGGLDPESQQLLEESGRVWVFDTAISKWSYIDPMPDTPFPQARSRHAVAASEHPLPSSAAQEAGAAAVAPHGSVFICNGKGADGVLGDCWCFDVGAATWSKFPDPPDPAREGTAMTLTGNRLYRFGGFEGHTYVGGQVDYLRIAKSTFDDKGGKSEAAVIAETDKWESLVADADEAIPGPRSGAGFHPITTGQGRNYIICISGEKGPKAGESDHESTSCSDVWSYQTQPTGMTGASFKDAARQLVGAKTAEGAWAPVDIPEYSKTEGEVPSPFPRTYFATAYEGSFEKMGIVVWGGVDSSETRLGDGWLLTVG